MSDHDPVNRPSHYQIMPGVEVYDVRMGLLAKMHGVAPGAADDWSRAWEYLTRMWGKNGLEDAKKARWYLDKLIGKLEQHEQESRVAVAIDKLASHAELHSAIFAHDRFAPEYPAQHPVCPDCGAPEGDLHYVLCPRLPVPEAHAEAVEAAFAEQAQFYEARADIIGQNGNEGEHYEQPVDVNDWRTWQVGDLVERVSWRNPQVYTLGNLYPVVGFCGDKVQICDDTGRGSYCEHNTEELTQRFKWHSRPAKTDE